MWGFITGTKVNKMDATKDCKNIVFSESQLSVLMFVVMM